MKKYVSLLMIQIVTFAISASTQVTLQNKIFNVDTLSHFKAGPGTMYTSLSLKSQSSDKAFQAFVMTMDMKGHDNVEYCMELGQDTTLSTERISSIAKRKSDANTHYFAAINADFYITASYVPKYVGEPHMDCIMKGEIASTGYLNAADYGHFFMDYDKNMWCDNPQQSFVVTYPDGTSVAMPRINEDIFDNETVLFNSKYGRQTRVSGCTEVQLALAEGEEWGVNKPIKLVVTSAPNTAGATPIKKGGAVLSAMGTAATKIAALKQGDEITVNFTITMQDYKVSPQVKECSGGDVVILKRGEVIYEAHRFINARDSNNPRTMVGYNEDRSKMVWCVVDGRSSVSSGCTYPEGAELMHFLGCYDAVNFDGGGSSGMYIDALGIMNNPSDGSERAVANGLFAVLNAPTDNEISEIRFVDWVKELPKYGYYTPKFYGYNKYGILINTDLKGVTLSCPVELGEIIEDGTRLFSNGGGTHTLTATYNGISTTLAVSVDDKTEPIFRHPKILLDTFNNYKVDVYGVIRGEDVSLDNTAFTWSSSEESVATVDENGVIKALKDGNTIVTGTVGDFTKSVEVVVETPTKRYQSIDPDLDVSTWTLEVNNISNASVTNIAGDGFAVDYTATSTRKLYITLAKDLVSWSRPDSLKIELNPGTSNIKTLYVYAEDYRTPGVEVEYSFSPELMAGATNSVLIPLSEMLDVKDMSSFPIVFKRFYLVLADAKDSTHHMEFGDISWVYNNIPAESSGIETIAYSLDNTFLLLPNLVQAGEVVKISAAECEGYTVNSMNGTEVKQGKGTDLDTTGMTPGLYLVTVKYSGGVKIAKLIVK